VTQGRRPISVRAISARDWFGFPNRGNAGSDRGAMHRIDCDTRLRFHPLPRRGGKSARGPADPGFGDARARCRGANCDANDRGHCSKTRHSFGLRGDDNATEGPRAVARARLAAVPAPWQHRADSGAQPRIKRRPER
jgi:hypothetical protein